MVETLGGDDFTEPLRVCGWQSLINEQEQRAALGGEVGGGDRRRRPGFLE